ncbi:MAG: hypothetical protein JWM21_4472 [Acidobacteria bacterium]|nr:hypothetical protein [Acidobacteriota bacterium]
MCLPARRDTPHLPETVFIAIMGGHTQVRPTVFNGLLSLLILF